MSDARDERIWERGWEGHAEAQARRMASLTLIEKLEWLEEAHARVLHMRPGTVREREPGPARAADKDPHRPA